MERKPSPEKAGAPEENASGSHHTLRHNQFEVDVYRLIQLTQESPETIVPISDFGDDLGDTKWNDDNKNVVHPEQVIAAIRSAGTTEAAIAAHPELSTHIWKIAGADYSLPVIVFESRVIDGMHRFVKAILDGHTSVKARIIEKIPAAAIIKIHENEWGGGQV